MEQEQPIESGVLTPMNQLAALIDSALNGDAAGTPQKTYGFALLVFKFGEGMDHRANYISNAERSSMLTALKEFIARMEGRYVSLDTSDSGR
jgi:hypothetical protein